MFPSARVAVEIAAGSRFDVALSLSKLGVRVRVMDIDPVVLSAPPPLEPFVDDLLSPHLEFYRGADFLYSLRLPEELQIPWVRLAKSLGASGAFLPLKDEVAFVPGIFLVGNGWRVLSKESPKKGRAKDRQEDESENRNPHPSGDGPSDP